MPAKKTLTAALYFQLLQNHSQKTLQKTYNLTPRTLAAFHAWKTIREKNAPRTTPTPPTPKKNHSKTPPSEIELVHTAIRTGLKALSDDHFITDAEFKKQTGPHLCPKLWRKISNQSYTDYLVVAQTTTYWGTPQVTAWAISNLSGTRPSFPHLDDI